MCLILPAFSSPELKASPHCSKSSKSSEGGQGETVSSVSAFFQSSLRSSLQEAATPATDSPDTRFSVMAAVVLSGCLCQSRKGPYLPFDPQCVRLLPRTNVLACSRFRMQFAIRYADAKSHSPPSSPKIYSRMRDSASLTVISRPRAVPLLYILCCGGSPGRTSLQVPMSLLCV